ncbi:hypothetical protein N0V93_002110 [Gnomoniopsis smithogilvyi]|uniref:FAD-binding PCMH-type domain-containing protein n=1 Tax=Gnomoniopsis smithogilvyi TaxID=1191159 RepID=A0A9W8Z522_9PEZI|nr:hypothetical protein N0V93_002110 [Gnomoniopsis smithogilvyi]
MVSLSLKAGSCRASVQTFVSILGLCATLSHALPSQVNSNSIIAARQNATLEDCLSSAGIESSFSSSSNWTTDIEAWNSRLSPVPSAVVFPKTEAEVSAALQCATATNTKVTTLGGNRSFSSMGFGRNDGALIVNLKYMKVLEYDEATEILTYGGPVMISDAAGFLWNNYNRALPHGRCPDVGMTGVAASGFGTLSRASGTVLDNIVGVRVAIANGSIVDADANVNSDLYWAVRGAASSMGVVLKFKIQTLTPPSLTVTNYTIAFPANYNVTQQDNVDALLGTQAWAQSADNNDLVSIRFSLKKPSKLEGFFYGTAADFESVSASLLKYLPSVMEVTSSEFDFWNSEDIATPGMIKQTITPRRFFYIASVTVPESAPLDNETAWQLFSNTAYAAALPDATASGFVDIWGGAYTNTLSADTSAWKHDKNLLLIRWDIRTKAYNISFADTTIDTMRAGFYQFVDGYKAAGGSPGGFTTYRDERWSIEETAEYLYGGNYARLQEIKTAFDPSEMFNTDPQAIPALQVMER